LLVLIITHEGEPRGSGQYSEAPYEVNTGSAASIGRDPNLDSENSALVLNMFQELNYRFNQTIIMITHNPEAAAMCRHIVRMRDGHIVEPAASVQL